MLKGKKMKNKIWATVLGIAFVFLFVPQTLQASEHSLKIVYEYEGKAIEGAVFDIYKVAEVSEEMKLEEIKIPEHMLPTDSGVTNADGIVVFPNQSVGLESGIYYVEGHDCESEGVIYRCNSFLVSLPNRGADGELYCDVVAYPKSVIPEEKIDVTVTKIWKDDNNVEEKRTDEVKVNLLLNGEIFDTIILSEENEWTYCWEELSGVGEWKVEEIDIPDGYEVSVEEMLTNKNLLEFEIINSYEKEVEKPSTLPQTGLLKWPVPVLAGTGLLFFMIGWDKRQKDEK